MSDKLYAERDHEELGEFYTRHVMAITAERLHDKSAIAGELAWRDSRIEEQGRRLMELVVCKDAAITFLAIYEKVQPELVDKLNAIEAMVDFKNARLADLEQRVSAMSPVVDAAIEFNAKLVRLDKDGSDEAFGKLNRAIMDYLRPGRGVPAVMMREQVKAMAVQLAHGVELVSRLREYLMPDVVSVAGRIIAKAGSQPSNMTLLDVLSAAEREFFGQ
jgi:hypothetical protein